MPLPEERLFQRCLLHTGASSSTCAQCHMTIGSAFWEFELDELEARHVCGVETIRVTAALPPPRIAARPQPLPDPARPRRHARRLGRAQRVAGL